LLTEKQALKCLKIEREGFAGEISSLSLNMNSKFTFAHALILFVVKNVFIFGFAFYFLPDDEKALA